MAWACLVTGKVQHQCARDLKTVSRSESDGSNEGHGPRESNGSAPSNGGHEDNGSPPKEGPDETCQGGCSDGSENEKPAPPSSCAPVEWEPYFAKLATYEYAMHGVAVVFPREIFNTKAAFTDLAVASASTKSTPGAPSCHDGEWDMRQQSWLDAVSQDCTGLRDPILVMCQQAANYAPNTGACNATGTW
jgi:hypothetical protein